MKYIPSASLMAVNSDDLSITDLATIVDLIIKTANAIGKLFNDDIYVRNNYSRPIDVAVRFSYKKQWRTMGWFNLAPGEVGHILSLRVDYSNVYFHAHCYDGTTWGNGDYTERIDYRTCEFTEVDTGRWHGNNFTYTFYSSK